MRSNIAWQPLLSRQARWRVVDSSGWSNHLNDTHVNSRISNNGKLKIKSVFFLHVSLHKVLIFYSKPNFPWPLCCEELNQLTFILCPDIATYILSSFLCFLSGSKQVYGLIFVSYWLFSTFMYATCSNTLCTPWNKSLFFHFEMYLYIINWDDYIM